jgi:hypothetical protein
MVSHSHHDVGEDGKNKRKIKLCGLGVKKNPPHCHCQHTLLIVNNGGKKEEDGGKREEGGVRREEGGGRREEGGTHQV